MNPTQEILNYSQNCANALHSKSSGHIKHFLFDEEMEFLEKQSNSEASTIVTACQAQLSLGLDYFYTVQQQLIATQQAWAAVIAEKERFNAFGWQTRPHDFSRALHTCLFMIPKRSNMGLPGPLQGGNGIRASIEGQADVSPNATIRTVGYNNGNDLPDYEDSPLHRTEFEQWAGPETVSYLEYDEGDYEPEEDEQSDGSQAESIYELEEDEQSDRSQDADEEDSTYQPTSPTLNLEHRHEFNPWKAFLRENAISIPAPKRSIHDDYTDFQAEIEDGETKRRRVK